jgi:hypothetical protein
MQRIHGDLFSTEAGLRTSQESSAKVCGSHLRVDCPIHLAEQASLHGDFGPELHGIETHVSQVCTRSLASSGYLLTVAAPASILPSDTTTEQQFHSRCIPQCPAMLTHIKLWSPYEPTGNRGAQTAVFELDSRISKPPYIDVCQSLASETGLKSRNVEKRINLNAV